MAASKQGHTYVNTFPQCSPASVGLAQARPNYGVIFKIIYGLVHMRVLEEYCTVRGGCLLSFAIGFRLRFVCIQDT